MAIIAFSNPTPTSALTPVLPENAQLITPADADTFERPVHVWVNTTGGTVRCVPAGRLTTVDFVVTASSYLPCRVTAVYATGTTATTLHAIY